MSSSAHIDNKKKDILILGKGPTERSEHTLTAEKMYLINFTEPALQWSKQLLVCEWCINL